MKILILILSILIGCGSEPPESLHTQQFITSDAIRPRANGVENNFGKVGPLPCSPANKAECVNEEQSDDSRYVFSNAPASQQTFDLSDALVTEVGIGRSIARATIFARAQKNVRGVGANHSAVIFFLVIDGVKYATDALPLTSSTWEEMQTTLTIPNVQILADINVEIGIECPLDVCVNSLAPVGVRVSQLYITVVHYGPPAAPLVTSRLQPASYLEADMQNMKMRLDWTQNTTEPVGRWNIECSTDGINYISCGSVLYPQEMIFVGDGPDNEMEAGYMRINAEGPGGVSSWVYAYQKGMNAAFDPVANTCPTGACFNAKRGGDTEDGWEWRRRNQSLTYTVLTGEDPNPITDITSPSLPIFAGGTLVTPWHCGAACNASGFVALYPLRGNNVGPGLLISY